MYSDVIYILEKKIIIKKAYKWSQTYAETISHGCVLNFYYHFVGFLFAKLFSKLILCIKKIFFLPKKVVTVPKLFLH